MHRLRWFVAVGLAVALSATVAGTAAEPVKCCVTCGAMYRKDFPRCPTDGGRVAPMEVDPLIGSGALEPYVIDALIGEGAMGRVYRAHHGRLPGKQYALKVLRGDLAAEQTMRLRFAKEAETASTLAHPNVVTVLDFGSSKKGLLYIAMELVEGTSIQDLVEQGGPMPAARAIRLARGIAQGLAYAHDRGLVHRDLKPANVLVVGAGDAEVARIVDFGIAISNDPDDARLTATTVEVFHRGQRIAAHARSHLRGRHTTDPAHMPKAHQQHLEWSPSRLIAWGRTIGPHTAALVEAILADRPHPEQGYRSCLGILRLAKRYGDARLEQACARGARLFVCPGHVRRYKGLGVLAAA